MSNPITQLNDHELAQIRAYHTLQEIADRYGCSRQYVHELCQKRGVAPQTPHAINRRRSAPMRAKALERVGEVGLAATSRELEVSVKTLLSWGAKGLSPNNRKAPPC